MDAELDATTSTLALMPPTEVKHCSTTNTGRILCSTSSAGTKEKGRQALLRGHLPVTRWKRSTCKPTRTATQ
eukprot:8605249-Prorocentrum_lima.AAC.1